MTSARFWWSRSLWFFFCCPLIRDRKWWWFIGRAWAASAWKSILNFQNCVRADALCSRKKKNAWRMRRWIVCSRITMRRFTLSRRRKRTIARVFLLCTSWKVRASAVVCCEDVPDFIHLNCPLCPFSVAEQLTQALVRNVVDLNL